MTDNTSVKKQEDDPIRFAEFLETSPPSRVVSLLDFTDIHDVGGKYSRKMANVIIYPEIQIHCTSDTCNGPRFFRLEKETETILNAKGYTFFYVTYICSNCRKFTKTFSLAAKVNDQKLDGSCYKFGELPIYGPPVSAKLIKLIGPDRDLFLKGRTCENQGLGIGAFGYYRRVIENQKSRIFDEIIKVSQKIGADQEFIAQMELAKQETQFSKAISQIKAGIPQVLL